MAEQKLNLCDMAEEEKRECSAAGGYEFWRAMLKAQSSMGAALKDRVNSHFGNKYATLESVLDVVKEPLNTNGLVFTQFVEHITGEGSKAICIRTRVVHARTGYCGIEFVTEAPLKDPSDPQKMGSAVTYGKRYALMACFGIPADDDDGNAAASPPSKLDKLADKFMAAAKAKDKKALESCLVEAEALNAPDNITKKIASKIKELE